MNYIDCSKARFFTLWPLGNGPAVSTHKTRTAAVKRGCKLARETGNHYAVSFEADSTRCVNFIRP